MFQMTKFLFDELENIVGKGRSASCWHILPFTMFLHGSELLKSQDCVVKAVFAM